MTETPDLLHRFWGIRPADVKPLGGGMNSETWAVEHQGSTYVAKRVPPTEIAELVAGCEVASTLADAGSSRDDQCPPLTELVLTEHALALLERVPGRELEGETDEEQRWIAGTLAGVHAAGGPASGPSTAAFAGMGLSAAAGVEAHPWLAPAIEAVRAETDPLTVTWSVLHTDPSPEAFIHDDGSGVTGLIDWAGATRGPVLYDVASAVMYLGGSDHAAAFLATYRLRVHSTLTKCSCSTRSDGSGGRAGRILRLASGGPRHDGRGRPSRQREGTRRRTAEGLRDLVSTPPRTQRSGSSPDTPR